MRLTANHIREFVGVSRTDFQRWLTVLPPYASQPTQARKARLFESRDLVFFAITSILIDEIGLRLDAVAEFSAPIRSEINKLSDLSNESRWVILAHSKGIGWSIGASSSEDSDLYLKIDTTQIWFRVHQFMGLTSDWAQSNLPLGLFPISEPLHRQLIA